MAEKPKGVGVNGNLIPAKKGEVRNPLGRPKKIQGFEDVMLKVFGSAPTKPKKDEHGNAVLGKNGEPILEPILDRNGEPIADFMEYMLHNLQQKAMKDPKIAMWLLEKHYGLAAINQQDASNTNILVQVNMPTEYVKLDEDE